MTVTFYELYMLRGPSPGVIYTLKDKSLTIGRDPLSDILINDPEVSRQHALLIITPSGDFRIQDLGSTNGTFVEGKRLRSEPMVLRPSNAITMGGAVTLIFRERSEIDQTDPQEADDNAQIDNDEAPDYVASRSELSESGRPAAASVPQREMEVRETDMLSKQPLNEKDQAKLAYQKQQQAAVVYTSDDIRSPSQIGTDSHEELSPNLILGLVLLLLCGCVSILLFLVYLGGDSLLRQIGLVP